MPPAARNERRPKIVAREWKILRAVTRAAPDDEAQLKLRIGELEELIVGAEEKEARRRAAGVIPAERSIFAAPGAMPLRYAEKKAMEQQRLKGWLGIATLGLLLVLAAAWFCFRLLVVL
ncbi:MAG: hypothetical protein ACKO2G_02940 [Verrucomicrobiales bacterium]